MKPGWWDGFLTKYGYYLLYVFIITMCVNATIFILQPNSFCYEVIDNRSLYHSLYYEPVTECVLVTATDAIKIEQSFSNMKLLGWGLGVPSFIGWCLTSPKARRYYKKKRLFTN